MATRGTRERAGNGLPPALPGERRACLGRAGRIGIYVAGSGAPLLLVHSINAAASAYEVRPIFEALRHRYRVFAPDLPGFGSAERGPRDYRIRLYVDALHDTLEVIEAEAGAAPVHALAVSLSAEFLARAAIERPAAFRSLALITPTGFGRGSSRRRGPAEASRENAALHRFLCLPGVGRGLFALLVTRPSIRFFLRKTFGSAAIDEGLAAYDHRSAHQPGAAYAPFAFLAGRLFSRDIRDLYERLTLPVWLAHGTQGDFKDFSEADWIDARPKWHRQAFATGALPHFEAPDAFLAAYEAFLARVEEPAPAPA